MFPGWNRTSERKGPLVNVGLAIIAVILEILSAAGRPSELRRAVVMHELIAGMARASGGQHSRTGGSGQMRGRAFRRAERGLVVILLLDVVAGLLFAIVEAGPGPRATPSGQPGEGSSSLSHTR